MNPKDLLLAVEKATPLLKNEEGFRDKAYRHKRSDGTWEPWTIGYGFTFDETGKPFSPKSTMTRERADAFFAKQVKNRAQQILSTLPGVVLNINQMAALLSLHHNIGPTYWAQSSVKRFLLAKQYTKAADAFLLWKRGNTADDLLPRRKRERKLFLEPVV